MLLEKRYNYILILLGVGVVFSTFLFKLNTGSFLKISDEAYKEVTKYEIQIRKNSISIQSVKDNIYNIDSLYFDYLEVLNNPNPCISKMQNQLKDLSKVELILIFNYALMDNIELYTTEIDSEKISREVEIASRFNCDVKPDLIFEKKDGEFMLKEVKFYDDFLICVCDSINLNLYLKLL